MITAGFLIWYCFGNGIDYFEGDFTALIPSVFLGTLSAVGYMLLFYQMEYTQKCRKFQAFLQYYGVHSLVVMVIHPILLMIIMYPFGSKIAALTGMCKDLTAILLFLFLVIGEIPFIRIIEQDLPFLIGRKGKKENG
jgi:fucose 4-O-acetylase-like acetyltransferase